MICPNCSTENAEFHLFCHCCGSALPIVQEGLTQYFERQEDVSQPSLEEQTVPAETEIPEQPDAFPEPEAEVVPQKGRHWPAVLIMAILTVLGLLLFYTGYSPEAPSVSSVEYCFEIQDGVLDFYGLYYTGGESLTIPESVNGQTVTALADYCFVDCDFLTEIILPDTLESIGDFAFADCDSLRGIYITENVTTIGEYAFDSCTALEAVSISESVLEISEGAFVDCYKLRHVFYAGTGKQWLQLYAEYINGQVTVYASDGSFSHDG